MAVQLILKRENKSVPVEEAKLPEAVQEPTADDGFDYSVKVMEEDSSLSKEGSSLSEEGVLTPDAPEGSNTPDTMYFTAGSDYDIYDILAQFKKFAIKYATFEEAVDHLNEFVEEYFKGDGLDSFKAALRSGYEYFIDGLLDVIRETMKWKVLRI
jgi:hypothetical protein